MGAITREIGVGLARKWQKSGHFLRDGIASGRGVHRKMGVSIQKSRSNFRGESGKSRNFRFFGVGVV